MNYTTIKLTVNQAIHIKFMIADISYGVTDNGDVYNLKSVRKLRCVVVGLTKGYCINGRFKSLQAIRYLLVKQNIDYPF